MDLFTHALLTRLFLGPGRSTLLAGLAPDLPWYLTYPVWVTAQGQLRQALTTSTWPDPPPWMETLHHAAHSFPVAIAAAAIVRWRTGHWPRQVLAAWLLHIAIDIPTHSRRHWGPQFLWPFSDMAVDGIPWAEVASHQFATVLQRYWDRPGC